METGEIYNTPPSGYPDLEIVTLSGLTAAEVQNRVNAVVELVTVRPAVGALQSVKAVLQCLPEDKALPVDALASIAGVSQTTARRCLKELGAEKVPVIYNGTHADGWRLNGSL